MKTEHLLEFLVICTPIKWLLLIMCVVFFASGDMAVAMRLVVGIYAIFLFFYMNSSKKRLKKNWKTGSIRKLTNRMLQKKAKRD